MILMKLMHPKTLHLILTNLNNLTVDTVNAQVNSISWHQHRQMLKLLLKIWL